MVVGVQGHQSPKDLAERGEIADRRSSRAFETPSRYGSLRCRAPTAPGDRTPDEKHNNCADYRADKPSALTRLIPPKRLTKVCRNDGTDNPKNRRQNEALRFIRTRRDELSDHSGDEADDDGPDKSQFDLLDATFHQQHCLSPTTQLDRKRQSPKAARSARRGESWACLCSRSLR